MGISSYPIYGISLEDAISDVFQLNDPKDNPDVNSNYQSFLFFLKNYMGLEDKHFHIVDPDGRDSYQIYFGEYFDGEYSKDNYKKIIDNLDKTFDDIKRIENEWDNEDKDEFIACFNEPTMQYAWEQFFRLKDYIRNTNPEVIAISEYG